MPVTTTIDVTTTAESDYKLHEESSRGLRQDKESNGRGRSNSRSRRSKSRSRSPRKESQRRSRSPQKRSWSPQRRSRSQWKSLKEKIQEKSNRNWPSHSATTMMTPNTEGGGISEGANSVEEALFKVGAYAEQVADVVVGACFVCLETRRCNKCFRAIGCGVAALVAVALGFQLIGDQYLLNHGFFEIGYDRASVCPRPDEWQYTNADDGSSPCPGLCHGEGGLKLVPCSSAGWNDGCNSCSYQEDGQGVLCTARGCRDGCRYQQFFYRPGQLVPHASGDSCNTCRCHQYRGAATNDNGEDRYEYAVVCTEKKCKTCLHQGSVYQYGETFTDPCQGVCTCHDLGESGYVSCVGNGDDHNNNGCGDNYCVWQGQVYQENQCFASNDGINMCACLEDGQVACSDCENYRLSAS